MSAPAVGEVVAEKYRVERELGQGGMGVVLAATHLHLGNLVAIKCLLPEAAVVPEALARFVQEARTCARLRSEHIVRVYDVGTQPSGAPFLVMELLDGRDLSAHLQDRGPLPIDELVGYAVEVCEGLAEAHEAGVVHRDLKPSNLFVVPRKSGGRGSVKILDFGISKLMDPAPATSGSLSQTASGALLGSPYYMSPEQITNAAAVDARCDIWSLGVVLFELCTGRRPFVADSAPALLSKILMEPAPSLRSLRPEAPLWLDAIVARCLQKSPDQRFQSVIGLAHALAAGPANDPLGQTAPAPPSNADQRAILARREQLMMQLDSTALGDQPATPEQVRELFSSHNVPTVCLSVARRDASEVDLSVALPGRSGRRPLVLGAAGLLLASAGGTAAWAAWSRRQPVIIRGSSTLGGMILPHWREALEREGIQVEVTSPGTSRGIEALIASGGSMLASASRRATPDELARGRGKLQEHLIGHDAIAIVVNVHNPLPHLSLPQLRDLFSGKIRDWSELGAPPNPIHMLLRPEEFGGHEALRTLLGNDLHFVEGAEVVRANDELLRRIQADRLAVSFASFTAVGPARQVPIGQTEQGPFLTPSTTSIRQGTYPLVRPLMFYSWGKPQGTAQRFLTFARSIPAQDALLGAGFVPLR